VTIFFDGNPWTPAEIALLITHLQVALALAQGAS